MSSSNLAVAKEHIATVSVVTATSSDPKYPATAMLDHDEKTFWMTTGLYPQEVVISLPSTQDISFVEVHSRNVRHFTILRSDKNQPTSFEEVWGTDVPASDSMQKNQKGIKPVPARFIKLRIDSGWEEFCAIHTIIIQ